MAKVACDDGVSKTGASRSAVTVKAVLVGLVVVVAINIWATHTEMYVRGSRLTLAHFPLALFAALLGQLMLNRWLRLSVQELLVVISMGLF